MAQSRALIMSMSVCGKFRAITYLSRSPASSAVSAAAVVEIPFTKNITNMHIPLIQLLLLVLSRRRRQMPILYHIKSTRRKPTNYPC